MSNKVVILGYARTAFTKASDPMTGRGKGKLAHVTPLNLMVPVINKVVKDSKIDPKDIETILTGCVNQEAEQGLNIARMAVLHKDCVLKENTGGATIDRFCGSSMHVIADAKNSILAGEGDVILCTGVQSMSRVPMTGWNAMIDGEVYNAHPAGFLNMGVTAENLARKYNVDRRTQEEFAIMSQRKAANAQEKGHLKKEIVPIDGVDADDCVRKDANLSALSELRPAFEEKGTVTAGTSSPVTDGASAVLLSSESYAKKNNLPVMAEILSFAGSGCAPEIMGIGPVEASRKALKRAGLTMKDIDVVELNEAFAAQSISVLKEMEKQGMKIDPEKLNIDGGAIAIGHPLGASGARIVGKAANLLQRTGKRYALATMCIGGGQGVAMVIENPNAKKSPAPKP